MNVKQEKILRRKIPIHIGIRNYNIEIHDQTRYRLR